MIDEKFIETVERLRDRVEEFRVALHKRYKRATAQVNSEDIKVTARQIAETWLVTMSRRDDLAVAISRERTAGLSVHFQRLLTASERSSRRSVYDAAIKEILRDFGSDVVVPMKQAEGSGGGSFVLSAPSKVFVPTAFLGHSFRPNDKTVVNCVRETLEAIGIDVVTGKKPRAATISDKIKRRIDLQQIFVGLYTRLDRISGKDTYTTSTWVSEEKVYALVKGKPLVLLREEGIESIGGMHADQEWISFSRDSLHVLQTQLLEMFDISTIGLSE